MKRAFAFAALAAGFQLAALAQDYPSKTVSLVVPAAPGGPSDVLARALSDKLHASIGQDVVVENRGGANGTIGVASVVRSAPDGHAVLFSVDGPITTIPALMTGISYDASKDLMPVAVIGDGGDVVLAVPAASPAKNARELAELLRKDPAAANYVSSGAGFPSHIVAELYKREGRFDAQHVAVRGAGAAMGELLSGRYSFSFPPASVAAPQAKAGKIRVLAVAAEKRNVLFPDTPTFTESGYPAIAPPGYWIATYVPAATPAASVKKLASATQEATRSDDFAKLLKLQGMVATDMSPEQMQARVQKETAFWKKTVRELDIKME
ncbi:MAG: tripartite tricarboxylate transporter substrate binding protein [Gammaproteobacteria bacterium]|nr:tripartite tricarboxylate transporter substrate binding protein [Gammaproteobacteria bacterium]